LGTAPQLLIPGLGGLCRFMPWSAPGCFPEDYSEGQHGGKMQRRGWDSALCRESEESPFLHLASPSPPFSPPSSSILITPQLAKSEPPSCEGLSLFFSQPPERQQAASKSVPRVTSVEGVVRAGEEPRRRRLPRLAACQHRDAIHSRGPGEHPPSADRLRGPGACPARGFISAW